MRESFWGQTVQHGLPTQCHTLAPHAQPSAARPCFLASSPLGPDHRAPGQKSKKQQTKQTTTNKERERERVKKHGATWYLLDH